MVSLTFLCYALFMFDDKDAVCFKKGILSLLILLFFCFLSCSGNEESSESESTKISEKVVIVFHLPDSLGDNSYTDNLAYGIHKAAVENNLLVYDVSPADWDDAIVKIKKVFTSYREIIGAEENADVSVLFVFANEGYLELLRLKKEFGDYLTSTENPFTYLLFESEEISADDYSQDEETDLSALSTVYMPLYGASYLAGKAVKELLSSKTNPRVIVLLANDFMRSQNDGLIGFSQGYGASYEQIYNYYDSMENTDESQVMTTLDFLVETINNQEEDGDINGFNSQDIAYKIANNDNFNHFDLYFPICGGSIHGLLRYNREWGSESFYTVGMDSDMSAYSSQVPFSVVRHIDKAAALCVKQWVADGKIPHYQRLGLEEGYTELVISKGYENLSQTADENLSEAIEMEKRYYEN